MTGSTLAALAASLLSLLFSYIPGFKTWYNPLDPYAKRLIMLALVVAVALGAFSFACAGLADDFSVKVTCDSFGAWGLVRAVIAAVAANQATYLITPHKSQKNSDNGSGAVSHSQISTLAKDNGPNPPMSYSH